MDSDLVKSKNRVVRKGIDSDERRRRQQTQQIEIRKNKKDQQLNKRRNEATEVRDNSETASSELEQDFTKLAALIINGTLEEKYNATVQVRKHLSVEVNPPAEAVVANNLVKYLVEFLKYDQHPQLQFEAAWALTNIASGPSVHTNHVIDSGAIPLFVHLLQSPNNDIREQAVWALGNIAGDGPAARDKVLETDAVKLLISLVTPQATITLVKNATWAFSNFCRGKQAPQKEKVRPLVPVLCALARASDTDILSDALWALSYITDGNSALIGDILTEGICPHLVELLSHPDTQVVTPALRTVGNIVTGDDEQTQNVINANALPALRSLLSGNMRKPILKEATWTVSNILAGSYEQVSAVLNADLIPILVQFLLNSEWDVKKEACWAISNATCCKAREHIIKLVESNAISGLASILRSTDSKMILVALEGIENILKVADNEPELLTYLIRLCEEAEVPELLEHVQTFCQTSSYAKAGALIQKYFSADDDEELGMGEETGGDNSGVFQFSNLENNGGNGGGSLNFGDMQFS